MVNVRVSAPLWRPWIDSLRFHSLFECTREFSPSISLWLCIYFTCDFIRLPIENTHTQIRRIEDDRQHSCDFRQQINNKNWNGFFLFFSFVWFFLFSSPHSIQYIRMTRIQQQQHQQKSTLFSRVVTAVEVDRLCEMRCRQLFHFSQFSTEEKRERRVEYSFLDEMIFLKLYF